MGVIKLMTTLSELYTSIVDDVPALASVTEKQKSVDDATIAKNALANKLTVAQSVALLAQNAVDTANIAFEAVVVVDAMNPTTEEQIELDEKQDVVDAAVIAKSDADTAVSNAQTLLTTAQTALTTAQTALTLAQTALTTAQGTGNLDVLAKGLSITDFGMVSNNMLRAILAARGETVKFEEPEVIHSDYNMRPYV